VGGRAQILKFLAGENVNSNEMDFSMAVFAGLGGRHFNNLAWTLLNDDETILP
jgi:hypothetical protein